MKRAIAVATVVGVVAIASAAILVASGKSPFCSIHAGSNDPVACEAGAMTAAAQTSAKVLGKYDVAMAGCRFSCATQAEYDAASVVAQPGAQDGKLTRCPVSGVVFTVDADRPRVHVGADDYVTCCDTCAEKLRKNPRRFLRV